MKKQIAGIAIFVILYGAFLVFMLKDKIWPKVHVPSFAAGDCVSQDFSNEFEKKVYRLVILKVGKKDYLVYNYGLNDKLNVMEHKGKLYPTGWQSANDIESLDRLAIKTSCPPIESLGYKK